MTDSLMPAALVAAGIVKQFGEQRALDQVDLTLRPGEIHGLLGENGSGKSTLIKVLSGFYRPDSGALTLGGTDVELPLLPARSAAYGLQFVHQDLGLIPTLTVAENFCLPTLSAGTGPASSRSLNRRASDVLQQFDVQLDPSAQVWSLAGVEKAMLAIVRAVHSLQTTSPEQLTRVLVLDEPTVFLPRRDVERLFGLVRTLAGEGCAVMLVSHDLDEIKEVTDRVTVFRDGKVSGAAATGDCSRDDLISMIVGRHVELVQAGSMPVPAPGTPPVLQVRDVSGAIAAQVSFDVAAGEIVGLAGLGGSGYDEVPYLLFGARRAAAGGITLRQRDWPLRRMQPHRALRAGLVLLPSDRRRTAGIGSLDVIDNVSLPRLARFRRWFGLDRAAMRRDTESLMDRFDVRPRDAGHLFGTLSGGNQQKALLSKWLATEPAVVLIDEPTQGVDIGARAQIFDLLREIAAQGGAVICASSDHEQLAALTDRTLIFSHGRVISELSGPDMTKQRITEACFDTESLSSGAS